MVKAYVLIETEGLEVNKIANELLNLDEIETAHVIYGRYDIICLVKAENVIELKETVLQKIGKVKGIVNTSSMIIADDE